MYIYIFYCLYVLNLIMSHHVTYYFNIYIYVYVSSCLV